mmetsp:Transcript_30878/g.84485  ORF Transcript_30878/g.84485 Transcript_30878/m.84485 type:complete len:220 (+) Transcript_30878:354-1013(+)
MHDLQGHACTSADRDVADICLGGPEALRVLGGRVDKNFEHREALCAEWSEVENVRPQHSRDGGARRRGCPWAPRLVVGRGREARLRGRAHRRRTAIARRAKSDPGRPLFPGVLEGGRRPLRHSLGAQHELGCRWVANIGEVYGQCARLALEHHKQRLVVPALGGGGAKLVHQLATVRAHLSNRTGDLVRRVAIHSADGEGREARVSGRLRHGGEESSQH